MALKSIPDIVEQVQSSDGPNKRQKLNPFLIVRYAIIIPMKQDADCKFHTDPEHDGTHWDRLTVVVAAGDDRKFTMFAIILKLNYAHRATQE